MIFFSRTSTVWQKADIFPQKHQQRVLPHDITSKALRLSAVLSQDEKEERILRNRNVFEEKRGGILENINDKKQFQSNIRNQLQRKKKENEERDNPVNGAKVSSTYFSSTDSGALTDSQIRFHGRQGHGFAAERANTQIDKAMGRDAKILGDDNAANGADRSVDGQAIQTKYCQNAKASVNAAFDLKTGEYRYLDKNNNGQPMQLEVPPEQYEQAINLMKQKIRDGKVPGVNDPEMARALVRKGNVSYETACNIAKAGNIDSLIFDARNGAVIARNAFGIAATITFAHALWSGKSLEEAVDDAMYSGVTTGGAGFVSYVISSQFARTGIYTGLHKAIQQPVIGVIKALPPGVRNCLLASMQTNALAYGGTASKNLAKLWTSNIITGAIFTLVLSAEDISRFFSGQISGAQLFKNITTLAGGLSSATVVGSAAGSVFGPAGMVIGGIIGGIAGGAGAKAILDSFIEDDAIAMVRILNHHIVPLAQEYLLNEEELHLVLEDLKTQLIQSKLLEMFASTDRDAFADDFLRGIIEKITAFRVRIILPGNEQFLAGMERVLKCNYRPAVCSHAASKKADTVAIGQELLHKTVSQHAADKAWYVTKQMNLANQQKEVVLTNMKNSEHAHHLQIKSQQKELNLLLDELDNLGK